MVAQEVIDAELARIAGETGKLTPDDVLAAAQDEASPPHELFEWDDTEAARLWRIEQARAVIRSVRVEIKTETKTVSTVFYVRDPSRESKSQGYVSLPKLRTDDELMREALAGEFGRAAANLNRAKSLAEALKLLAEVEEIASVAERVERLKDATSPTAA